MPPKKCCGYSCIAACGAAEDSLPAPRLPSMVPAALRNRKPPAKHACLCPCFSPPGPSPAAPWGLQATCKPSRPLPNSNRTPDFVMLFPFPGLRRPSPRLTWSGLAFLSGLTVPPLLGVAAQRVPGCADSDPLGLIQNRQIQIWTQHVPGDGFLVAAHLGCILSCFGWESGGIQMARAAKVHCTVCFLKPTPTEGPVRLGPFLLPLLCLL